MLKTAFFDPKWPYLAIGSPRKPKWVEHWLNMVEHCQTHPGGSVWAFRAPKKCHPGAPEAFKIVIFGPKTPFGAAGTAYGKLWPFWAKKGRFWAVLGPPLTFSQGLKRPN